MKRNLVLLFLVASVAFLVAIGFLDEALRLNLQGTSVIYACIVGLLGGEIIVSWLHSEKSVWAAVSRTRKDRIVFFCSLGVFWFVGGLAEILKTEFEFLGLSCILYALGFCIFIVTPLLFCSRETKNRLWGHPIRESS